MKAFDDSFRNSNIQLIAGIDEAGRGPLAGPVVAAAVVFHPDTIIDGVDDSKKLSEKKRENLFPLIIQNALSYSIEVINNQIIDEKNILQAALFAMSNAVINLSVKPDLLLIDGNKIFTSDIPALPVIKGDSQSFSIAAASILAKVTRDRIMIKHAEEFPLYAWENNKGYPTKKHINAIKTFGITPLHRKTFLRKIIPVEQYEFYK